MFSWIRRIIKSSVKNDGIIKAHSKLIKKIESFLGYKISHPEYFIKALTHRSYLEISPEIEKSNERLEFLGDSVLGLIVAEFLFKEFSDEGEGYLTKTRSHLVNREALADAAERMNLYKFILYDRRFLKGSKEGMRTIMSDALEAFIGAIYLDKGIEKAEVFVCEKIIKPSLESGKFQVDKNYKGQLLEFCHANKKYTPIYKIVTEEGPDHDKCFTIEVFLGNELVGTGSGKNKKNAEQSAAQNALELLTPNNS